MDNKIADISNPSVLIPSDGCMDIYFSLFNSMYDGLSVFEVCQNKIKALYLNERYFNTVGYTPQQYVPYIENVTVTLFEDDEQRIFNLARECLKSGTDFICDVRGYRYDGSVGWFSIRARTVDFIKSDNPVFLASINDITSIKDLEHRDKISKERYRILEETSSAFLFEYTLSRDNMLFFPERGKNYETENYGMYLRRSDRVYADDAIYFYYFLMRSCRRERKGFIDFRYFDDNVNDYIPARLHYSSVADEYGFILKILGRIEDITEQSGFTAEIMSKKYGSAFEGLLSADEAIAKINEKISAEGSKGTLIFADIDDFGDFESKYGRNVADSAIALAAKIVSEVFGDCIVFKFPEDEFMIYAEDMPETDLHGRYEKLQAACGTITCSGCDVGISFSAGAAWTYNSSKVNIKDYFITAERVLFKAKKDGKGRLYAEKIIF